MKKISTKDLYLCKLMKKIDEDYDPREYVLGIGKTKYWFSGEKYIIGKKKFSDIYVDVFTETVYSADIDGISKNGKWCVIDASPIITDYNKVPLGILADSLKELNPTFFKPEVKEKKNIKQKIFSLKKK